MSEADARFLFDCDAILVNHGGMKAADRAVRVQGLRSDVR